MALNKSKTVETFEDSQVGEDSQDLDSQLGGFNFFAMEEPDPESSEETLVLGQETTAAEKGETGKGSHKKKPSMNIVYGGGYAPGSVTLASFLQT